MNHQRIPTKDDMPPNDSWVLVDDEGFVGLVGPIWALNVEDAPQIVGFRAADRHRNLNGVVQGGMLMTLADRGLGRIVRDSNGAPTATIHFSYDFMGAGEIGAFIELHSRIARETKSLCFMEGQVIADGKVIGRANGVWKKFRADAAT
ncbi:PaaI family thioesterase [Pseudooceanicola sp.]|uniref:PaaI family thioesterase n=1 Tax=Pseudooceanicola sp. TaxID=1914328 RepID=UPI0026255E70|nr:PaaI family thioesterase [Pseudooceanicola sp.]MDF1854990.1 PaaI family thioesterase [Pseudooceanicola sp.]